MSRRKQMMVCVKRFGTVVILLLAACGEGPKTAPSPQGSGTTVASTVEIAGTLAPKTPDSDKLLVFAYVNVPAGVSPAALEPASVSGIGPDRSFALTGIPPGNVTILVLADKGNDGAIDPGDAIAILDDADHKLTALQAGDAALIKDLAVDAGQSKVTAGAIDVRRAAVTSPRTQTP